MTDDRFDPLIDQAPARYVVGIDLGTTNSAVTFIDTDAVDWKIEVLSIPQCVAPGEVESLDTLPSFHFQPPRTSGSDRHESLKLPWDRKSPTYCVGAYARDQTARTSGRGVASAKSWLCHAAVDRTSELLPWHAAEDVKRLSPVDVSSRYLKHIRQAWDQQFPQQPLADQDIVLTLPASFDEIARELTIEAAAMAGLKRVVLIEEPQAAFYAWVYKHASDWDQKVSIGQKILVCDIGGGTTDFTLIRVRPSADSNESGAQKIQFHRVAVGNHLILGGDNLDLAIARYLEQKLTNGKRLEPYQWDVLVGSSRNLKEQLLNDVDESTQVSVTIPGRGARLLGGSLSTEVTAGEIRQLILDGFLPEVALSEKPRSQQSGFQELGLPYATDPAITKYLGEFLTDHAEAGSESSGEGLPLEQSARPDVVLFNGGFFASPILRSTVLNRIRDWFQSQDQPDWQPDLLDNDRLDLAVARGAAYYGMVRRDKGVRIAASLARSYYVSIGGQPEQVICLLPGNAEAGQDFELDRNLALTISQPVEFSLYVSSTRLTDAAGDILPVDTEQMRALPPIRTALKARSRNEKRDIPVRLHVGLTEIGTIDLACHEVDSDRRWKLQFDIRSATQTDVQSHSGLGESQGFVDESVWEPCEAAIESVFGEDGDQPPRQLVEQLTTITEMPREQWPMSLLRRTWSALMQFEHGRRKSAAHEARWLNLLGFSLRPGYGVALDDWRVTETWRMVNGKLVHGTPNIRNESLILWRRLAGGLSRGQQVAIAESLLPSIRAMIGKSLGKKVKGNAVQLRPEESVEVWRLLGSLEWLSMNVKLELGESILSVMLKPKMQPARNAMIWALGRIGQRTPLYGPLNSVLAPYAVQPWIERLLTEPATQKIVQLAVVQMARMTDDRYRDLDETTRNQVVGWLEDGAANGSWIQLIKQVGQFDAEAQGQVLGESLPQGLRLVG